MLVHERKAMLGDQFDNITFLQYTTLGCFQRAKLYSRCEMNIDILIFMIFLQNIE